MATEHKDEEKLPHTSLSEASADGGITTSKVLIGTPGDSNDIIYTPPPSTSNMTPSNSGETTTSHTSKSADSGAATASHDTLSNTTRQSANGSSSNISVREYIYFLPYPLPPGTPIPYSIHLPHRNPLNLPSKQFEPTSTLVLTSPLRTFVDIRIYKPFSTPAAVSGANPGSPEHLEWAFAGTSTSVPKQQLSSSSSSSSAGDESSSSGGWENVTHSTWTHWLDSRFPVGDESIPVDEGDMYPIEADLTLEVGHAFHPALEAVKTHEEMWRDEEVKATGGTAKGKSKICVVLRCQDDGAGVRGVVVRVGQYVQGIVMQGLETTVERWEWVEKEGDEGRGNWERKVRIGEAFLPCAVCFRGEVLAVGGKVRFGAFEWGVEEVWEWV